MFDDEVGELDDAVFQLKQQLSSANAAREAAERDRDEARDQIQQMVNKAADASLDGYRELGQRAADAENSLDRERMAREAAERERDAAVQWLEKGKEVGNGFLDTPSKSHIVDIICIIGWERDRLRDEVEKAAKDKDMAGNEAQENLDRAIAAEADRERLAGEVIELHKRQYAAEARMAAAGDALTVPPEPSLSICSRGMQLDHYLRQIRAAMDFLGTPPPLAVVKITPMVHATLAEAPEFIEMIGDAKYGDIIVVLPKGTDRG